MSTYIYEAYDKSGSLLRGEYEAAKKQEVVEHLLRRSLVPVSVHSLRNIDRRTWSVTWFEHLTRVDILFLIRNLATTSKAGLSIVESMEVLISDTSRPYLKRVLQKVQASIKNGQSLSISFEPFKNDLPPVFIGMLRSGEASGQLDKSLDALGQSLTKEYDLRQRVRSALIYPGVLMAASAGVVVLLLVFVLPRLINAFKASGVTLPFITKFFIVLSGVITYSFLLDLFLLAAIVWVFFYARKSPKGRRLILRIFGYLPIAGEVLEKVALVRFARTFGGLVESGISAVESLELTADSIGNEYYRQALLEASHEIKNGVPLSKSLGAQPKLFPKILVSLITVGERTGSLGSVLLSFADFYENEVNTKLKDLTSVLEPLLLLVMGLIVGAIALSILLPIYQLVGNFS